MSSRQVAKLLLLGDDTLTTLDDQSIKRILSIVRARYNKLEAELRPAYTSAVQLTATLDVSLQEAAARTLLLKLRALLQLMQVSDAAELSARQVVGVLAAETRTAETLISVYAPAATATVPDATAAALSSNLAARLVAAAQQFGVQAESEVISGLIKQQGFAATAELLRARYGSLSSQLQTVIRTESITASDAARRAVYAENGVEYVMRIATQDKRVCGYCAARAGVVYKIDDAPQLLHPNDRCYNVPFKREWLDQNLIDVAWVRNHASEVLARSAEAPKTGAAPFEKYRGVQPPKPVWTPTGGFR